MRFYIIFTTVTPLFSKNLQKNNTMMLSEGLKKTLFWENLQLTCTFPIPPNLLSPKEEHV